MLKKLTGGALGALGDAIKIVLAVIVLIGLVKWAQANPDAASVALNKVMGAVVALITWVCDQITAALA